MYITHPNTQKQITLSSLHFFHLYYPIPLIPIGLFPFLTVPKRTAFPGHEVSTPDTACAKDLRIVHHLADICP